MNKWMRTLALAGTLMMGATACEKLGTQADTLDDAAFQAEAALVAIDGMFQDLDLVQDPGLQSMGFEGMGMGRNRGGGQGGQGAGCQAGTGGQRFRCQDLVRDGFTHTCDVTFFDADEVAQVDGFDEATTASIHMVMETSGSVDKDYWRASVSRSRDMWITDLLTDAHLLNGTGTGSISRSGNPQDGTTKSFEMASTATWVNVVHLQPRTDNPYPASGTITRTITATMTENGEIKGSRDVEVIVTFDGTQFVTMLVNGKSVEIDLANRGVKGRSGNGRNGNG